MQYQETDVDVEGYSDADWASDSDDRRSTSGNVFMMSDGAISLTSKKVTNSSSFNVGVGIHCIMF